MEAWRLGHLTEIMKFSRVAMEEKKNQGIMGRKGLQKKKKGMTLINDKNNCLSFMLPIL